ncbi:MAG TPA: hypothetical protein VGG19_04760 [Tepidisphaeraceae bacterium]|jgi:hypothetical protein
MNFGIVLVGGPFDRQLVVHDTDKISSDFSGGRDGSPTSTTYRLHYNDGLTISVISLDATDQIHRFHKSGCSGSFDEYEYNGTSSALAEGH